MLCYDGITKRHLERGSRIFTPTQIIMKLIVDVRAQKWFEDEVGIPEGSGIRFLGKIYGSSPLHEGFSLGVIVDTPKEPLAITIHNNIPYFIEKNDDWFFSGHDLEVTVDDKYHEPDYIYHKREE